MTTFLWILAALVFLTIVVLSTYKDNKEDVITDDEYNRLSEEEFNKWMDQIEDKRELNIEIDIDTKVDAPTTKKTVKKVVKKSVKKNTKKSSK